VLQQRECVKERMVEWGQRRKTAKKVEKGRDMHDA